MLTSHVLMVRPTRFGFNRENAASNSFQEDGPVYGAFSEFDHLVSVLAEAGIEVSVYHQTPECISPDAVFPNNWVSFHEEGAVLYPMLSPMRRTERRLDILQDLGKPLLWDLSHFEDDARFLEGTGSLVLDRGEKFCFACISPRTDRMLAFQWCQRMGYRLIDFDTQGSIYHTNVVGMVGEGLAIVCTDAVIDKSVLQLFIDLDEYEVIELGIDQMASFAGNVLQLHGGKGKVIAMSTAALEAYSPNQRRVLERHGSIVSSPIPTIERVGGGSVRCMLAEVF